MTSTKKSEAALEILKTDSRGRVIVTPERREQLLDEFERGGMSGASFAKHYGLRYSTFAYWRQRRRKAGRRSAGARSAMPFVFVESGQPEIRSEGNGVRIELGTGAVMTLHGTEDVPLAAALIAALNKHA